MDTINKQFAAEDTLYTLPPWEAIIMSFWDSLAGLFLSPDGMAVAVIFILGILFVKLHRKIHEK